MRRSRVVGELVRGLATGNAELIGIDPAQLGPTRAVPVGDHLWQIGIPQEVGGIPVRHGRLPGPPGLLTALSRLTRRPPPWGMAADQMRTMKEGALVDGGKAVRELEIECAPVRTALEEVIASMFA